MDNSVVEANNFMTKIILSMSTYDEVTLGQLDDQFSTLD